jgi:hypothetical protein
LASYTRTSKGCNTPSGRTGTDPNNPFMVGSGGRRRAQYLRIAQRVSDPRVVEVSNPQVVPPGSNVAAIDARTELDTEGYLAPQEPGFRHTYATYQDMVGRTRTRILGLKIRRPQGRVGSSPTVPTESKLLQKRGKIVPFGSPSWRLPAPVDTVLTPVVGRNVDSGSQVGQKKQRRGFHRQAQGRQV